MLRPMSTFNEMKSVYNLNSYGGIKYSYFLGCGVGLGGDY